MSNEINTLEEFEQACIRHDLTYGYSDDSRWYRAGLASETEIVAAADKFEPADVERIWNKVVDSKLVEGARESFYWRWTKRLSND